MHASAAAARFPIRPGTRVSAFSSPARRLNGTPRAEERDKWGEDMPATARRDSAAHKCGTTTGKRGSRVALVCAAMIATCSHAFAVKIPIQASLSGGGEVPPNDSPPKSLMEGTFDTDANTLEWRVTYSGLATPPIGAYFHGPILRRCRDARPGRFARAHRVRGVRLSPARGDAAAACRRKDCRVQRQPALAGTGH